MTWRPTDRVESGELDNRIRGRITGWIRLFGRAEPLRLDLRGDCLPDLAGWRFRLVRLEPVPDWSRAVDVAGLSTDQTGDAGQITAAREVRHVDGPAKEVLERQQTPDLPPLPRQRALYIEWYSGRNGRVVIEDTRLGVERIGRPAFALPAAELASHTQDLRRRLAELPTLEPTGQPGPGPTVAASPGNRGDPADLPASRDSPLHDIPSATIRTAPAVDDLQSTVNETPQAGKTSAGNTSADKSNSNN